MKTKYKDNALETWLRKNNMSTKSLIKKMNCSVFLIYKIKNGHPVSLNSAKKLFTATNGEVLAKI